MASIIIDYRSGKDKTYECILCGRLYVHKTSASRHMKACKVVVDTLYNITNSNYNLLNSFGNEDVSYMFKNTDALNRFLYKCIKMREQGVWLLFSKKHFSFAEPKNNNIRFCGETKVLEIYDGNTWTTRGKNNKEILDASTLSLRDIFIRLKPYRFIEEDELFIDYLRRFVRFVAKPLKWADIPEWMEVIMKYRSSYVMADAERDPQYIKNELSLQKQSIHKHILYQLEKMK